MSRKCFDQMLDEREYANYQRWLANQSHSMNYSLSSLQTEFRNNMYLNRYDSFTRGCYIPPYMLVPNTSKKSRESYYFVKRNEQRSYCSNYYSGNHHYKGSGFYPNKKVDDSRKNPRSNHNDALLQTSRRQFMNWNEISSGHQYKDNLDENRLSKRSSRILNCESNGEASNIRSDQIQKCIYDSKLEYPESSGNEEKTPDQSCNRTHTSSLPADRVNTQSDQDVKHYVVNSSKSQLSVPSLVLPTRDLSPEYASWFCAEEQQQIANMLRDVNLRHERQLRRDIMTARGEPPCSDDSASSSFDHNSSDSQQRSFSSGDEDDGITILVSPSDHPLPDVIGTDIALDINGDYLEKSTSDYFEEFQSIFTTSPEKNIINTLVKECLKEEVCKSLPSGDENINITPSPNIPNETTQNQPKINKDTTEKECGSNTDTFSRDEERGLVLENTVDVISKTDLIETKPSCSHPCESQKEILLNPTLTPLQPIGTAGNLNQPSAFTDVSKDSIKNLVESSDSNSLDTSVNRSRPENPVLVKTKQNKTISEPRWGKSAYETSCPSDLNPRSMLEQNPTSKGKCNFSFAFKVPKFDYKNQKNKFPATVNVLRPIPYLGNDSHRSIIYKNPVVVQNNYRNQQRLSYTNEAFDKTFRVPVDSFRKVSELDSGYRNLYRMHFYEKPERRHGYFSTASQNLPLDIEKSGGMVRSDSCLMRNALNLSSVEFQRNSASESNLPIKKSLDLDKSYKRISVDELFHPKTEHVEATELKKLLNIPQSMQASDENIFPPYRNYVSPTDHLKQILRIGENETHNDHHHVIAEIIRKDDHDTKHCLPSESVHNSYRGKTTSSTASQTELNINGTETKFVRIGKIPLKDVDQSRIHLYNDMDSSRKANKEMVDVTTVRKFKSIENRSDCSTSPSNLHSSYDIKHCTKSPDCTDIGGGSVVSLKNNIKIDVQCGDDNSMKIFDKEIPPCKDSSLNCQELDSQKTKSGRRSNRRKFKNGRFKLYRESIFSERDLNPCTKFEGNTTCLMEGVDVNKAHKEINKSYACSSSDKTFIEKGFGNSTSQIRCKGLPSPKCAITDSKTPTIVVSQPLSIMKEQKKFNVKESYSKNKFYRQVKYPTVPQYIRNNLASSETDIATKEIKMDDINAKEENGIFSDGIEEKHARNKYKQLDLRPLRKGEMTSAEKVEEEHMFEATVNPIDAKVTRSSIKDEERNSQSRKGASTSEDQAKFIEEKDSKLESCDKNLSYRRRHRSPYRPWRLDRDTRYMNSYRFYYEQNYRENVRIPSIRNKERMPKWNFKTNDELQKTSIVKSLPIPNNQEPKYSQSNSTHSLNSNIIESLRGEKIVLETIYRKEDDSEAVDDLKTFSAPDGDRSPNKYGYVDRDMYSRSLSPSGTINTNIGVSCVLKETIETVEVIKSKTCFEKMENRSTILIPEEKSKNLSSEQKLNLADQVKDPRTKPKVTEIHGIGFASDKDLNCSAFDLKNVLDSKCNILNVYTDFGKTFIPQNKVYVSNTEYDNNLNDFGSKENLINNDVSKSRKVGVSSTRNDTGATVSELNSNVYEADILKDGVFNAPKGKIEGNIKEKESTRDLKKRMATLLDISSSVTGRSILKSGLNDVALLPTINPEMISHVNSSTANYSSTANKDEIVSIANKSQENSALVNVASCDISPFKVLDLKTDHAYPSDGNISVSRK